MLYVTLFQSLRRVSFHARDKVMASQRGSESGPGFLRRKGSNEMMAIKRNEEGTRFPQQNNPSLNPEIKSLFHTA